MHIPRWLPGAVISLLCLFFMLRWAADQPAPEFPRGATAHSQLLVAAGIILILATVRGWRWRSILGALGMRRLGIEPFALMIVCYMGNTVLPARGGDLLRVGLLSRRHRLDWKSVAGTLVPERLLDVIVLAVMLITLSVLGAADSDLGATPAYLAAGGTIALIAGLFGYHEARVRGYFDAIADRIRPFTRATRVLIGPRGLALLGVTMLIWLTEVLVFWLVVDAGWGAISLASAAFVVVLASLATAIPAAPGSVGTFDAAVVFGLASAGVPASATLTLVVLYRLVLFGPVTIIGVGTLIARYGGRRALQYAHEPSAEAPATSH